MKILQRLIILGLILLVVKSSIAQTAPGYMGKKLIIEYSATGAPALFRINKNGKRGIDIFPPDFKLPMNYGHKLSASYSINRKSAYGASFELFTTGVDYSGLTMTQSIIEDNKVSETNTYRASGDAILNSYGLSIYKSFYGNGISPLGRHQNVGFKILYAQTDLSKVNFTTYKRNNNNLQAEFTDYQLPSKTPGSLEWGLTYGIGINRILFDRIVFNLGFEMAIMFSALGELGEDWTGSFDFTDYSAVSTNGTVGNEYNKNLSSETELFKKMGSERVFTSQFFNLKIGIGFLAH